MSEDGRRRAEEVGAGAGGAGVGQAAYQEAGYATKHRVDRATRKGGKVSAAQVKLQDKKLRPLKSQHGMHLPAGAKGRDNAGYHRAYPTDLPHGRTIRALGHTHEGKAGVAVGAALTAASGVGALVLAHHELNPKKVQKMAENPFLTKANKAEVKKAACACGCGCKSCSSGKKMSKAGSCSCSCKKCGGGDEGNANTYPFGKSAFGIEHEIEKGLSQILDGGMDALKGLKGGIKGGSFGAAPGSTSGMLGAKSGASMRSGAKSFGRFAAKNPIGAAGAVAGGGAVGGYALSRPLKGNKN